ncbi:AaceriAFL158Cp [[Ashbya] aceris (nom. inval.)]|nr:AaceriAFL158Cp [[Ashbya] aceris (nom. inval.)]
MTGLLDELVVQPWHRLRWGFLPVRRRLQEDADRPATATEDGSLKDGSQKATSLDTCTEEKYEYRDEGKRPWWKYLDEQEYRVAKASSGKTRSWSWFGSAKSKEEKKLLIKLDVLLAFYSCLAYWVKYLDTVNLNNAYVSGMKEELGMGGNDLVNTQAMFTVGAVIFQLPFIFILNKVPLNYVLPGLDIGWSILTLGAAHVNNVSQLKAIRFLIGVFEAPAYLSYQYLFGCFYKHDEIVRRSAFYYLGQYAGILSSGGIQSAVSATMDGRNGLSGWRWSFIIDAIISIIVGVLGFYMLPGDPNNCYSIFLTDDEIRLARRRLEESNIDKSDFSSKVFDKALWKNIMTDWKIYILSIWNVFCWNNNNGPAGAYLLWMKSLERFSTPTLNRLSMITPALGMVYLVLTSLIADLGHSRLAAILLTQVFNFMGNVILAVWDVSESAKWFAFMLQYFGWAMAPVLYSWQNDICRRDARARAVILVVMNTIAQAMQAWISVLVWKTSEAPRFLKGFTFTSVDIFCLSIWTFVVLWFYKRDEKMHCRENNIILVNSKKDIYKHPV